MPQAEAVHSQLISVFVDVHKIQSLVTSTFRSSCAYLLFVLYHDLSETGHYVPTINCLTNIQFVLIEKEEVKRRDEWRRERGGVRDVVADEGWLASSGNHIAIEIHGVGRAKHRIAQHSVAQYSSAQYSTVQCGTLMGLLSRRSKMDSL